LKRSGGDGSSEGKKVRVKIQKMVVPCPDVVLEKEGINLQRCDINLIV